MPTRIDPNHVMTVADRQKRILKNLRTDGGDKVAVLLDAESLWHLTTIIANEGFETRQGRSEAIRFALATTAKRYAKRAKNVTPK